MPTADQLIDLIRPDFDALNELLISQLGSEIDLIEEVSQYLIQSGGKRVRPLVTLMAARALKTNTMDHIPLAGSIECLHTATLFHDDVVDNSEARRGQPSANAAFGNATSVLVGDFVYSRAFQMMVSVGRLDILKVLADTTNQISEGEVWQLKINTVLMSLRASMIKSSHEKQRRCLRPPPPVRDLSPINLAKSLRL